MKTNLKTTPKRLRCADWDEYNEQLNHWFRDFTIELYAKYREELKNISPYSGEYAKGVCDTIADILVFERPDWTTNISDEKLKKIISSR